MVDGQPFFSTLHSQLAILNPKLSLSSLRSSNFELPTFSLSLVEEYHQKSHIHVETR